MIYPVIIGIITSAIYGINGDKLIGAQCWDDRYCINLYQHSHNISWDQALASCGDDNSILLKIENYDVQAHVNMLLAKHPSSPTDEAWIGGRRGRDGNLKTINGMQLGIHQQVEHMDDDNVDCLAIKIQPNDIDYFLDNCDEKNGNQYVICKTHLKEGKCSSIGTDFRWVNGVCYKTLYKVPENERESNKADFDWFSAQNMCNNLDGIGDALLDDPENSTLQELLPADKDVAWTGYMRKLWYWHNPSGTTDVMTFFNWTSKRKVQVNDACATIGTDGTWNYLSCSEKLSYYLCTNDTKRTGNTDTSTRSPTTQQLATTSTASTTSYIDPLTAESSSYNPTSITSVTLSTGILSPETESNTGLAVYAGAGAGGAVIVILIVVVLCVVRKKRSENDERMSTDTAAPNSAVSTNMRIPSSREQQYEMIPDGLFTPPGPSDDTVTPYAEFAGDPRNALPQTERGINYESADPLAPSYDTSIPDMYQNAGSENREPRDPEVKTGFDPVVSNDPPPASANIYSIVNKPEDNGAGDMEDVVVDNATYGKY